jgi:hypothetical protein
MSEVKTSPQYFHFPLGNSRISEMTAPAAKLLFVACLTLDSNKFLAKTGLNRLQLVFEGSFCSAPR